MSRKYNDTQTRILKDHSEDKLVVQHSQVVDPAIKQAKIIKDCTDGKTKYGYHAAKIPMTLLMQWGLEDGGDQLVYLQGKHNKNPELAKKLAARMNSNEFHAFRIWEGTVAASDILKEGKKV